MNNRYSSFVLVRVNMLKKSELWLFLVGILLVSIIGTTVGSFSLGITEKEFYFGKEDDVLIITQPGASTPLTSRVPFYIEKDLESISGITNISAETLGLCIISNRENTVVTVRGVTEDYNDLSLVEMASGKWLYNDENNEVNSFVGVVAGYSIAKQLDLSVNDHLLLSSSIVDIGLELIVKGIHEQTQTPIDEELFVSLENGQTLSGLTDTEVTFLRVKFNDNVISEDEINFLLQSTFTLNISLYSSYWDFHGNITDYSVKIFSYTREYLEMENFKSITEEISFILPFGRYIIVIENQELNDLIEKHITLDSTESVIFDLDEDLITLTVFTQYNNTPISNVEIIFNEIFFNMESKAFSDNNGQTKFIYVYNENGDYSLSGNYNGISRETKIHNKIESVTFDFLNILTFDIRNVTNGKPISGAEVTISESTTVQPIISDNNGIITCNITKSKGTVNVEYGNFSWNNVVNFRQSVSSVSGLFFTMPTIWLGTTNLSIIAYDFEDDIIVGANITLKDVITEEIFQGFTNASGMLFMSALKPSILYEMIISYDNYSLSRVISLESVNFLNISFNILQNTIPEFVITIVDGISLEIIEGAEIQIFETATDYLLFNSTSDSNGEFKIFVNSVFQARVEISFELFSCTKIIIVAPSGATTIPLGEVKVITSVFNYYREPLSNVNVTLTFFHSNQSIIQGFTNSTGIIEFIIPIGSFSLNISYLDKQIDSFYNVGNSGKFNTYYFIDIGKQYEISLRDKNNVKITEAFITINYEKDNSEFLTILSGITDSEGSIDIVSIITGKYILKISILEVTFFTEIEVLPYEDELTIFVDMDFDQLIEFKLNKWPGLRSYQISSSSEYVESFIDTSLSIIALSILSIVIIVTALSSLSLRSVVSFTIERYSVHTIPLLRKLGATKKQIAVSFAIQFSVFSTFISILGIFIGYFLVTEISQMQVTNIGGILIYPVLDYFLSTLIVITITLIVFITTYYQIIKMETEKIK